MINWIKRHCILSIFLSLLAFCSIPASLNYSGYCWEQKRWLSDEEFLLAMVEHAKASNFLQDIKNEKGEISKEDIKKFLKDNPACCRLDKGYIDKHDDRFISFWDKVTGEIYITGQAEYKLSEEDRKKNDWAGHYYNESLFITACGKTYFDFNWRLYKDGYQGLY